MSDNQFPQQHDEQGQADGERLIYSASDLALNQAALLREAADGEMIRAAVAQGWCIPPNTSKAMDVELGQAIVNNVIEAILALPTDQTALDRHDAELLAREAEARSRVLQANEDLRAEIAKHKAEVQEKLDAFHRAQRLEASHRAQRLRAILRDLRKRLAARRAAAGAPEETK